MTGMQSKGMRILPRYDRHISALPCASPDHDQDHYGILLQAAVPWRQVSHLPTSLAALIRPSPSMSGAA